MTEPDIKQKLDQVREARRGRQERACGTEACVGTNLTRSSPPLSSVLSVHPHTLPHPHSPPPSLFSLYCVHYPLPTLQTPHGDRKSEFSSFVLLKKNVSVGMCRSTKDSLKECVLLSPTSADIHRDRQTGGGGDNQSQTSV